MRLTQHIHMVASGDTGFSLTDPFDCTVYLVDGGGECALIDAGAGVQPQRILDAIAAAGFAHKSITKILLTHGHGDHAGGAAALANACDAAVYAMQPAAAYIAQGDMEALSLRRAVEAGVYAPDYTFAPCPVQPLQAGEQVRVGALMLTVVPSEGHSAGHCCYTLTENGKTVLFAGDAIQADGKIALQAIWDCDLQKYVQTVHRLAALHPETLLPSHGRISLTRGWLHTEKAEAALKTLALPKNSIGE